MSFSHSQLTYLEHLGIDVWLTRPAFEQDVVAPVQATSALEKVRSELQGNVSPAPVVPAPPAPSPVPAQVRTAAENPAARLAQIAPESLNQTVPTSSASNTPAPRFNIQFWCYSSGVWIISGEVELSPQHHMLVHNVAHFLQGKKRKPRHVGIFSWPMLDAPNIDQGGEIASKYLKQHIDQLQNLTKCKKLIAFDESSTWLTDMTPVVVPFTLSELLVSVDHKKALWQQLLPHQL
jgi:hypothetical protein